MGWARLGLGIIWFVGGTITLVRRYLWENDQPGFELDRLSIVALAMFVFGYWNLARGYRILATRRRGPTALEIPHRDPENLNSDFDFSEAKDIKSKPSPPLQKPGQAP